MSCSTRTRSTSETYSQKLSNFLAAAWETYNPVTQRLSVWTRDTANTFVSTVRTPTPISTVITDINSFTQSQAAEASSLTKQRRQKQVAPAAVDSLEREFHRTFSYEYKTWYDAFKEEAREDPDGPSADERWSQHVVKKLQRKSSYDSAHLYAATSAWLLLNRA
jgi:hypothetical protein